VTIDDGQGLAMGWYEAVRDTPLDYFLAALYATPRIAIVPVPVLLLSFARSIRSALSAKAPASLKRMQADRYFSLLSEAFGEHLNPDCFLAYGHYQKFGE
jgi:hypothetical protein